MKFPFASVIVIAQSQLRLSELTAQPSGNVKKFHKSKEIDEVHKRLREPCFRMFPVSLSLLHGKG
jgi:hypothetical protein